MRTLALSLLVVVVACDPGLYPEEAPLENIEFNGPGWVDDALVEPQATYWTAATILRVSDQEGLRIRDHWTREILAGIVEVEGFVGLRIETQEADGSGWGDDHLWANTYTVWKTEEALDAYVGSDLHLRGHDELRTKSTDFGSARWEAASGQIPEAREDYFGRFEFR